MKKKLLCAVLAVGLMVSVLGGCSLFSTGGEGGDAETGSDPIEMTENYTFEDPADLEYAKRYVIYADKSSTLVSSAAEYGMKAAYSILYADENDQPLGDYEFTICDTEENAQALIDLYAAEGSALTAAETDPTVLYSSVDGDAFAGTLVTFQSMGMISEATVSAYATFYAEMIGGTVQ